MALATVPVEAIDAAAAAARERPRGGLKRLAAACLYWPAYALGSCLRGLGWAAAAVRLGFADGRTGRG